MDLKQLTIQLRSELEGLKANYLQQEKPENKRDKVFFEYVKEKTTPVFQLIEEWEVLASSYVKNREVNVHPQQVVSTKENLDLILMHSYYIDVKRKRYMELYRSVHYVFDLILEDL
ncbi:hypothetical protein GCM10011351_06240 [Paraliobacillus quinghaiensis]|uniref:DUF1798 family protein n=1 Tax=Paraliobacillus quinghaiensis TaxID=470815 RepID=A0A917TI40_9BACI|nr:DUF1798 family protein [Paraliobacillus quinghaiensis]GGM23145.1 hypothetical protein GCM10011351_06240 [Paraliobacillus quinghaiensis]